MKRTLLLALSLVVCANNSGAVDRKTLTIASEGASPPWNAITPEGELAGFDIDVGRDLCRRMKIECTFVPQDWDGIIPALTVGKFDAIMSGMAITEKRKKSIAFSKPYAGGFNQLVMRKDLDLPPTNTSAALDLTTIDSEKRAKIEELRTALNGRTLGVLRSSNSEAVLNELFGKVATIRSYDSQDNMHLDLVAERIDGGLADYFTWKAFLDSNDGGIATLYGPQLSGGLWGPGVGVGLRQDDRELVAAFDSAIDAATRDGTLRRLSEQWFKIDVSPRTSN
ncbi:ABC transporter substrate-binding protein [Rhizobium sp. R634]|uniref:transporter substrate-binding domain-containing protein n=1 Tax=Rhizobium sp. R634 TaxID=1764274 RepID=UPI000B52C843|nr:transporter substrate-binding domain-containing protein [Rhizobium sp. R634]OWV73066.1 ABC transporter substrate-binding protein [Rhizobium sp. R634]OWV73285.1 ABC transporter substrate-binding protein [Rhizobium sp. R634]